MVARCAGCGGELTRCAYAGRPPRFCPRPDCQRERRDGVRLLERRSPPAPEVLRARSRAAEPEPPTMPPGPPSAWSPAERDRVRDELADIIDDAVRAGWRMPRGSSASIEAIRLVPGLGMSRYGELQIAEARHAVGLCGCGLAPAAGEVSCRFCLVDSSRALTPRDVARRRRAIDDARSSAGASSASGLPRPAEAAKPATLRARAGAGKRRRARLPSRTEVGDASAFPLQWPDSWNRTPFERRRAGQFQRGFADARELVLHELRLLRASNVVITSNLPVKPNGQPYAAHDTGGDNGIAVWFVLRGDERVFACDRWLTTTANLNAIALSLGAMRGLDRWGAADIVARAFSGFTALPAGDGTEYVPPAQPPPPRAWREVLAIPDEVIYTHSAGGLEDDEMLGIVRARYRKRARELHPDLNGSGGDGGAEVDGG